MLLSRNKAILNTNPTASDFLPKIPSYPSPPSITGVVFHALLIHTFLPPLHSPFARIIFISRRLWRDYPFYNPVDNLRFILFIWKDIIRQFSVNGMAVITSQPLNCNLLCLSPFRPYNPLDTIVKPQFPTTSCAYAPHKPTIIRKKKTTCFSCNNYGYFSILYLYAQSTICNRVHDTGILSVYYFYMPHVWQWLNLSKEAKKLSSYP